jgi:hypothetical protein
MFMMYHNWDNYYVDKRCAKGYFDIDFNDINAAIWSTIPFYGAESFWLIPGTFDDEMNLLY